MGINKTDDAHTSVFTKCCHTQALLRALQSPCEMKRGCSQKCRFKKKNPTTRLRLLQSQPSKVVEELGENLALLPSPLVLLLLILRKGRLSPTQRNQCTTSICILLRGSHYHALSIRERKKKPKPRLN